MHRPSEYECDPEFTQFCKTALSFVNYSSVKGFGYIELVIILIRYISQEDVVKEDEISVWGTCMDIKSREDKRLNVFSTTVYVYSCQ